MKKMIVKIALGVLVVLLIGAVTFSKMKKIYPVGWNIHSKVYHQNEVAIGGYDPVAYLKAGEAVKGVEQWSYQHEGVSWQFASAENLKTFVEKPAEYLPEYGGYCAFAVSKSLTGMVAPAY